MNIPLLCYRISGWMVTFTNIFLAIFAIKTLRMWQGKYLYLALFFCFVALTNIISSITAIFLLNNLFLGYILAPVNFTLKALYLRASHRHKAVQWSVLGLIVIYIALTLFAAIYKDGYKQINTVGVLINRTFFIGFTVWNLTLLFRNRAQGGKVRHSPDFWFTATMFCFAFVGILFTVITDISYEAKSDLVLYGVFITENLLDSVIYYGYYKGMKLLR